MSPSKIRPFNALPPYARIRAFFTYEPSTGILRWRVALSNAIQVGQRAGKNIVAIYDTNYPTSRVIWVWMTGNDPGQFPVDHKNGNHQDNRWENLRLATYSQNSANQRVRSNTKTGLKGVTKSRRGGFYARIGDGGIRHHLGSFPTAVEAHAVYAAKAIEIYGEFARAE